MINTIGDLIKELQKYPQDALIFDIYDSHFEEIIYSDESPCGDPANPYCKFTEGFILL